MLNLEIEDMTTDTVYPIYVKSLATNTVVKFTAQNSGVVVAEGKPKLHKIGEIRHNWLSHDNSMWTPVKFDETEGILDKQLVEGWNGNSSYLRTLGFYDMNNASMFTADGKRNGTKFDHYRAVPIKDYPKWAKAVVLED
jgi:hypothetical protein